MSDPGLLFHDFHIHQVIFQPISNTRLSHKSLVSQLTLELSLTRCSLQIGCCIQPPVRVLHPFLLQHVQPLTWRRLGVAEYKQRLSSQSVHEPTPDTIEESVQQQHNDKHCWQRIHNLPDYTCYTCQWNCHHTPGSIHTNWAHRLLITHATAGDLQVEKKLWHHYQ